MRNDAVRISNGILAGMLDIHSLDEYQERFGDRWAYHLEPVLKGIILPHYDDMKLAKLDGWDLENEQGEPWPFSDLNLPTEIVGQSHLQAYVRAKELLLRRSSRRRDQECPGVMWFKSPAPIHSPSRPHFKSWLDYTVGKDDNHPLDEL